VISLPKLRPYTGDLVAPSPNRSVRKAPRIQGIVLHATADEGDEALSLSWMRSPKSRVSCHLLVSRAGRVTRLVGDQKRAWHAGRSRWRGTSDVNSITLGIEIANRNDGEPFTRAQYRRVADIVAHYCRQGLSLDDVVSHGEIAAGRKTDPRGWDWNHFRAMVRYRLQPADDPPSSLPPTRAPDPRGAADTTAPAVAPRVVAPPKQQVRAITTSKPVLYSRTLWLAGMTVLVSGGMLASEALDTAQRAGVTLPEEITKWALFGVGLVNIVLRFRTTQPLTCGQNIDRSHSEVMVERGSTR
jgi:N-acetylmuramoyl-L-alanine amidase